MVFTRKPLAAFARKLTVVEVWALPPAGLAEVLLREPPGLSIGKVKLSDGEVVLGVLAEPILCVGQRGNTQHGGWRAHTTAQSS